MAWPLGKSILESCAWGRAVVASDLGSRRELVREGETGILFPPGNVEQLVAAISFLAEQPEVAANMGAEGREVVRKRHAPEEHYQQMLRLYEQLTPPRCRPTKAQRAAVPGHRLRVAFIGGRGRFPNTAGFKPTTRKLAAVWLRWGMTSPYIAGPTSRPP